MNKSFGIPMVGFLLSFTLSTNLSANELPQWNLVVLPETPVLTQGRDQRPIPGAQPTRMDPMNEAAQQIAQTQPISWLLTPPENPRYWGIVTFRGFFEQYVAMVAASVLQQNGMQPTPEAMQALAPHMAQIQQAAAEFVRGPLCMGQIRVHSPSGIYTTHSARPIAVQFQDEYRSSPDLEAYRIADLTGVIESLQRASRQSAQEQGETELGPVLSIANVFTADRGVVPLAGPTLFQGLEQAIPAAPGQPAPQTAQMTAVFCVAY